MTTIDSKRIKSLKEFVHSQTRDMNHLDIAGWNKRADLLAILDEYPLAMQAQRLLSYQLDKLRVDLGGYEARVAIDKETIKISFETIDKLKAELEAEQRRRAAIAESLQAHQDKLDKLESELARWKKRSKA
jgi:chromosome segregation ATPase